MSCSAAKSSLLIDDKYIRMICSSSNEFELDPEYFVSLLINTVFNTFEYASDKNNRRRSRRIRKKIRAQCFVKFNNSDNEIYSLPGLLTDISLFGVCVSIGKEYSAKEFFIKNGNMLEVTTHAKNENTPVSFQCRICHVNRDAALNIGGTLIAPEQQAVSFFVKSLLGSEPLPGNMQ